MSVYERVVEFIQERDPFGDYFCEHDLTTIALTEPRDNEVERLRNLLRLAHSWMIPFDVMDETDRFEFDKAKAEVAAAVDPPHPPAQEKA